MSIDAILIAIRNTPTVVILERLTIEVFLNNGDRTSFANGTEIQFATAEIVDIAAAPANIATSPRATAPEYLFASQKAAICESAGASGIRLTPIAGASIRKQTTIQHIGATYIVFFVSRGDELR